MTEREDMMERMDLCKDYWSFENTRESEHMAQQKWLRQEEKSCIHTHTHTHNSGTPVVSELRRLRQENRWSPGICGPPGGCGLDLECSTEVSMLRT